MRFVIYENLKSMFARLEVYVFHAQKDIEALKYPAKTYRSDDGDLLVQGKTYNSPFSGKDVQREVDCGPWAEPNNNDYQIGQRLEEAILSLKYLRRELHEFEIVIAYLDKIQAGGDDVSDE